MDRNRNNYLIQAESARQDFLKYDQQNMIRRFGLEQDGERFYVLFFGRRFAVERSSGRVFAPSEPDGAHDSAPADVDAVMSIYDLLCYSKEGAVLSGEWKSLANLSPSSNFGSASKSDMGGMTARRFSGRLGELKAACLRLGGLPATKADAGFMFDAFPGFPIIFQFWEGDEEFAARVNYLFDANALDYIHFETAWYVAGALSELIEREL